MNTKFQASLTLLAMIIQVDAGFAKTYTVQSGDTLSGIAAREIGKPVYGPKGSLNVLLERNRQIKNQNRIYPQQVIQISPDAAPVAEAAPEPAAEAMPAAAPEATAEAAPEPAAASAAETKDHSFGIRLVGLLGRDHIEVRSKDRSYKTSLDSRLNKGFDLALYYKPTDAARLGIDIAAKQSQYRDSSDGRLQGETDTLKSLAVFAEVTLAKDWHLGLDLGTEEAFFFTATSTSTFALQAIFVDHARAFVGYDVLANDSWRVGIKGSMAYHLAAENDGVDASRGSSYRVGLPAAYQLGTHTTLEAGISYQRRNQGTDLTSQKTTSTDLQLGARWEF